MTQTTPANADLSIDKMPWPEFIDPPPTDLPYDDGEPAVLEAELRVLRGEEIQP
jgi:hypothetical protein